MFVIAVRFSIYPDMLEAFLPLMNVNASKSVAHEPGCRQFDVCQDSADPTKIFLYEVYDTEEAFQDHLVTAHFKAFDKATAPMIASKEIQSYVRLAQ